jgi:hypothetical protein
MRPVYLLPLCAVIAAACSDATNPAAPATPRTMTMTFRAAVGSAPSARTVASPGGALASVSADVDGSTLTITKAQLVLDEFRLKKVEDAECASVSGSDDDNGMDADDNDHDDDACERIEGGPLLLDLPLTDAAGATINVAATEGTYRELELRVRPVHDLDDADNAAFLAANPTFDGISVRIEGTFDGQPFTFSSDVDARLEIEFPSPLVVDHAGMNVTVNVDVASWFRTGAGALIDPRGAGVDGDVAALIADNIEASFRAFHDDDRDGHDDGGPGRH